MTSPDSGWRDIATAPKDEIVLIFLPDARAGWEIVTAWRSSNDPDGDWYRASQDSGFPIDIIPTHWMPLPSFPTPDDGRAE